MISMTFIDGSRTLLAMASNHYHQEVNNQDNDCLRQMGSYIKY